MWAVLLGRNSSFLTIPIGEGYLPGDGERALTGLGFGAQLAEVAVRIVRQRFADHRGSTLRVRTAEMVAALSLATDLGDGVPFEHGLHTTLVAMRLCELMGVRRLTHPVQASARPARSSSTSRQFDL